MEPLYRGHIWDLGNCLLYYTVKPLYCDLGNCPIGTLETVLYMEFVLNSEVIYSGTSLHWDLGKSL